MFYSSVGKMDSCLFRRYVRKGTCSPEYEMMGQRRATG